ncbi:hypothetical protein BKA93DRAFT_794782 [Sparassis latifolia]
MHETGREALKLFSRTDDDKIFAGENLDRCCLSIPTTGMAVANGVEGWCFLWKMCDGATSSCSWRRPPEGHPKRRSAVEPHSQHYHERERMMHTGYVCTISTCTVLVTDIQVKNFYVTLCRTLECFLTHLPEALPVEALNILKSGRDVTKRFAGRQSN